MTGASSGTTVNCNTGTLTDLKPTDQTQAAMATTNAGSNPWTVDAATTAATVCPEKWAYDAGEAIVKVVFTAERAWDAANGGNTSYSTEDISFYYMVFQVQAFQGIDGSEASQASAAVSIDFESFNNEEESTLGALSGLSASTAFAVTAAAYSLMF